MATPALETASFGGADPQAVKNKGKLISVAGIPDLKNVLAVNMMSTFYMSKDS
ncbi:MAG: hypothetical protein ACXWFF_13155 [Methylomonas sp.]